MANAFMASAQKSKREMASIQKGKSEKNTEEELRNITIRIPASMHKKAQLHRIETGESMTALVNRLLVAELG